jgi:regulator of protease activity HflC (stomatin/prohibitin superfamily)
MIRNSIIAGVGLFLLVLAGCSSCTTIKSGEVGIVSTFGRISPTPIYDGVHFLNPISSVTKAIVRTSVVQETASVVTGQNEGLTVGVDATLLYHITPQTAPEVYRNLGTGYEASVVEPTFHSALREVMSNYVAADLYGAKRTTIQTQIDTTVREQLQARGFVVENVLLKNITLPESVQTSIQKKQQQQQESEAMTYVLQKATQEAERKRIEAQGIKDFQTIVSQGISEPLLRWKGIEATEQLAQSPNAKIVVIGGKDGLPIILNGEK